DNTTDMVSVIDPKTFRIVRVFRVGAYPQHITPAWNLQHLYVENSGENTLTVIDPKTARPVRTLHGIPAPYNLYFTPDGTKPIDIKSAPDGKIFYVANQGLNGLTMLDPTNLRILGFIPTGAGAHGLAVSRDTRFLYVANRIAGTISVISFATRHVVATWHVG